MVRTVDKDVVVIEWRGLWRSARMSGNAPHLRSLARRLTHCVLRMRDQRATDAEDLAQEALARVVQRARVEGQAWETRSVEAANPVAALTLYLKRVVASVASARHRVQWRNKVTFMAEASLEDEERLNARLSACRDGLEDPYAANPAPEEATAGVTAGRIALGRDDRRDRTRAERLAVRLLEPLLPADTYRDKRVELLKLRLRLALVEPEERTRVLRAWMGAPLGADERRMRNTLDQGFVRLYRTLCDGLQRGGGASPHVHQRRKALVDELFALQASRDLGPEGAPPWVTPHKSCAHGSSSSPAR